MKGWSGTIAVVVLVVLFVADCENDNIKKRQAEAAYRAVQRTLVQNLAQKWRANQDWESKLAGGPDGNRISEVMSVELQRVWFGQPILFVGTLEDISQLPDGSYQVAATHDGVTSSRAFIMSSFGVRVACPEEVGNYLLAAHAKKDFFDSGLALVVQINDVIQERISGEGEDGATTLTRTGVGKCLDALYLGTERIWKN